MVRTENVFEEVNQHLKITDAILFFDDVVQDLLTKFIYLSCILTLEYFKFRNLTH